MSRSLLLLLGRHSVQSLVPATLISQVESLLENHRIQHAADLADQERRRQLYGGGNVDEDEAEQLQYIYQRIGFQCFKETLFEDAGKHLFEGGLDPRVLVSYFPNLRGAVDEAENTANMYAGVALHMPTESSVEEIIRNYSPHLSPNTREAPSTSELRKILLIAAEDMLEAFLRKCRTRRVLESQAGGGTTSSNRTDEYSVVDTVLVKLFARSEKTKDLYALLHEPHHIVLPEVESILIKNGQYNALCELFQQIGNHDKLLDIWAKIIDGEWSDEDLSDPVGTMVTYLMNLNESSDNKPSTYTQLTQKWALWLMHEKRVPEQGLKLLISSRSNSSRMSGKRSTRHQHNKSTPNSDLDARLDSEDQTLLFRVREINPTMALQYLEYLILQRGSKARDIHMEYATACIDELMGYLQKDEGIEKLWRAKASSYLTSSSSSYSSFSASPGSGSTSSPVPFVSYFASTTPDSPSKRARLKTLLFLQASGLYDASTVKDRILSASEGDKNLKTAKGKHKPLLSFEIAILESKLGNHRAVLDCLVHDVGDGVSAEAYCTGNNGSSLDAGRQVIPPRLCRTIAESTEGLSNWKDAVITTKDVTGDTQVSSGTLLRVLLEVYLSFDDAKKQTSDGKINQQLQVARLLNSQGVHLDVCDVMQTLPSSWPSHLLSSFITRSCRRTLHSSHESQILKMVSLAENWDVKERTWSVLRDEGFVVEEDAQGGEDSEVNAVLDEKIVLSASSDPPTVDVFHNPKDE